MNRLLYAILGVALFLGLVSCQDEVSDIGSSLVSNEVTIVVDSVYADLQASPEWLEKFDSRTTTKLLGRLTVPEYGSLNCSFVSQMMCATKMNIPDSVGVDKVDSIRLNLMVVRGQLTGDSLAPQQLRVYKLNKQLPSDITSAFDPTGYYDPSTPYGTRSYTISNLAKSDSAFKKENFVNIPVRLPDEFARELFTRYRANDPIFAWPQEFAKWFPGVYVEQNFGNGCVANVSYVQAYLFWNRKVRIVVPDEEGKMIYKEVLRRDSVCLLASQPEVLSSNNITYTPAESLRAMADAGKALITSPGGYRVNIKFPLRSLVEKFNNAGTELSVVAGLSLEIPARTVENEYGLKQAPTLLLVRKTDADSFFSKNRIPDNIDSFYARYDSETGTYRFSNMRQFFINKINELRSGKITSVEDEEFVLMPVALATEDVSNYDGSVTTYVTRALPYIASPTITLLDAEKALICFTFSSQQLR